MRCEQSLPTRQLHESCILGDAEHPTNPHKVDTEAEVMGGKGMPLLSMERRMGGAVFSSAWLISEYCVLGQLASSGGQIAHSRDLVNEHQRRPVRTPDSAVHGTLSLCR